MAWYADVENGEGNVGKRPFTGAMMPGQRVFQRVQDGDNWNYEEYIVNSKGEPIKPDYRYMQGGARSEMLNPDTGQFEQMVIDSSGKRLPQSFADSMGIKYQIAPGHESEGGLLSMAAKEWGPPAAMMLGAYGLGTAGNALMAGNSNALAAGGTLMPPASAIPSVGGSLMPVASAIPTGMGGAAGASTTGAATMDGLWDTLKTIGGVVKDYGGPISNIAGAFIGSDAARDAAQIQADAAGNAANATMGMYNQTRADLQPWQQAGIGALNQLTAGTQPGGQFVKPFGMQDFQTDPGYNFRLGEGMKALERSAAARGNLLSGGVLKGITRYGQDMASNEYQNAYNRYNADQGNAFNRLNQLSSGGQSAANQTGAFGANATNTATGYQTSGAAANAAGGMGAANALAGGLAGAYNTYQSGQLVNALTNKLNTSGYGNYGVDPYSVSGMYGDR